MLHSVFTTKTTRVHALDGAYDTEANHARDLSQQLTAVCHVAQVDVPDTATANAMALLSIAPIASTALPRWGEADAPAPSASPAALPLFPFRQSHPFGIGIIRERILALLREEARNRPARLAQYRTMVADFTQPWMAACDRLEAATIALNADVSDDVSDGFARAPANIPRSAEHRSAPMIRRIEAALAMLLPDPRASIHAQVDVWAREERLTALLDVIAPLRPLFVDGRMTLVDVVCAMDEFEREASALHPDARAPGCRSRALLRLPYREGDREPFHVNEASLAAARFAKASFEVYAEVKRRESRINGTEFVGVAWGMMRAFRLPECFGHRLSIAWFDAFARSNVLTDGRYWHVFGIAELGFGDIARRGAFSYDWLETISRGREFFRLLIDSRRAMHWLSERVDWEFECHRYDYPRINPLTDALIHDPQISNARARHFLMAFRDLHSMQNIASPDAGHLRRCAEMLLSPTYSDRLIDTFARLTAKERMVRLSDAQRMRSWLDTAAIAERTMRGTMTGRQCIFL